MHCVTLAIHATCTHAAAAPCQARGGGEEDPTNVYTAGRTCSTTFPEWKRRNDHPFLTRIRWKAVESRRGVAEKETRLPQIMHAATDCTSSDPCTHPQKAIARVMVVNSTRLIYCAAAAPPCCTRALDAATLVMRTEGLDLTLACGNEDAPLLSRFSTHARRAESKSMSWVVRTLLASAAASYTMDVTARRP